MESLNFKKYCIIGLGNVSNLTNFLSEISETDVAYVSGTGLVIATFSSKLHLAEIEKLINEKDKSYILFEMTPGFFSANIKDNKFQNTLFGGPIDNSQFHQNFMDTLEGLKNISIDFFTKSDEDVFDTLFESEENNKLDGIKLKDKEPDIDDILDRINEIGYEKLTKKEKDLLEKYSQK